MPQLRSDRAWTIGLVAVAIAARVAAVLVLQSHRVPHSTYEHGEIAANLLVGRGFAVKFLGAEGPTSQQAPIYPGLVAAAYAAGGVGTPRALLMLEIGQSLLGGGLVLGVLVLAREISPGNRAGGRIAGLAVAVHPTLVYAATHVQVALLAATLLTWVLALGYRLGRTGAARDGVLAGAALAALILTDPILGVAALGVGGAVAARRGVRGALRPLLIAASVAVIGLAPWTIRNLRVHGELVFIKSTFGYAFWQGNCSLSEGTDKVVRSSVERVLRGGRTGLDGWNRTLWEARHEAGYIDDIALTASDYAELGGMTEPARSRHLFRRAVGELRADPWRYPALCARRLRAFLLFDETNPKTRSLIYRTSHLGLSLFALLGWVAMGRSCRRLLAPSLLVVVAVAMFHSLTIVSARFHVPIEPLFALWGGCGAANLLAIVGAARSPTAFCTPRCKPVPCSRCGLV